MLNQIKEKVDTKRADLSTRSKTSRLWVKWAMLDCLQGPSTAWNRHISNSKKYANSKTYTLMYRFYRGFHVIRRSNQYWAVLSSDRAIEQTLMRSLKSSGAWPMEVEWLRKCEHCGPCLHPLHRNTPVPCRNSTTSPTWATSSTENSQKQGWIEITLI